MQIPGEVYSAIGAAAGGFVGGAIAGSRRVSKLRKSILDEVKKLVRAMLEEHKRICALCGMPVPDPAVTPSLGFHMTKKENDR